MTKLEKVDFTIETLDRLYPEIPIPLDHKDPYTLLIAVLLSAQSTDIRVNQITPLLFAKADCCKSISVNSSASPLKHCRPKPLFFNTRKMNPLIPVYLLFIIKRFKIDLLFLVFTILLFINVCCKLLYNLDDNIKGLGAKSNPMLETTLYFLEGISTE